MRPLSSCLQDAGKDFCTIDSGQRAEGRGPTNTDVNERRRNRGDQIRGHKATRQQRRRMAEISRLLVVNVLSIPTWHRKSCSLSAMGVSPSNSRPALEIPPFVPELMLFTSRCWSDKLNGLLRLGSPQDDVEHQSTFSQLHHPCQCLVPSLLGRAASESKGGRVSHFLYFFEFLSPPSLKT